MMRRPPVVSAIVFAYGPVRPRVVCILRYTQCLMWTTHENDDCDDDNHDHECMHMSEHNTHAYNMCCAHSRTRMCTLFHMPTSIHIPQLPLRHGNWRQGRIGTKRPRRADAPPIQMSTHKKGGIIGSNSRRDDLLCESAWSASSRTNTNTERDRPLPRTQTQRHLPALATTHQDPP
jgi:hypothetical protein